MTEAFLHYIWQHQMLGKGLAATDGQPVVVHRAGEPNHDAGPDFLNARIRIGEVEWAGNVEVHIHNSDWSAHRHHQDPAYNNVILHVVYEEAAHSGRKSTGNPVVLQNGRIPPTLELKPFLHPSLVANYEALAAPSPDNGIPCAARVGEVPEFILHSFLERLSIERIESKAATVRRLLEESHGDWTQTCYWLLARYFGGKVNALPFELLAKATDLNVLSRWNDEPLRLEALLMGQAGFLDGLFNEEYPRRLQADYLPLRAALGIEAVSGSLWKFHRMRPSSFPTVRISQFARFLSKTPHLFSQLLSVTDVKELERMFDCAASPYWDNHYRFDQPANDDKPKRLGKMQADLLIINAWIPLLFVYGVEHNRQQYKDQAIGLLAQLPAEKNVVIRRWNAAGVTPRNAAESQALLQLSGNYCNRRQCLECRIGFHLLDPK
ncbi:MAG: DUF2851 family protein [Bacteroidales bacterium]|nr:DUF2851 family protein [Bacteroidales bacterium]